MKLIIYLILFILLLYYLDNKEKFASISSALSQFKDFNNMNEVTQYDVLNSDKIKSILEYKDLNNIQPNDMDGIDLYKDKFWVMKDKGFSDIYNYESVVTKDSSASKSEAPKSEDAKSDAPKSEDAKTDAPKTDAPKTDAPKTEDAKTDAAKTDAAITLMEKIKELEIKDKKYKLIGTASNDYYNQYFLLYEREVPAVNVNKEFTSDDKFNNYFREKDNMDEVNTKLYEYVLGKVKKDTPEVIHMIGPRNKINIKDVINLSLGTFQLGPLVIKTMP